MKSLPGEKKYASVIKVGIMLNSDSNNNNNTRINSSKKKNNNSGNNNRITCINIDSFHSKITVNQDYSLKILDTIVIIYSAYLELNWLENCFF